MIQWSQPYERSEVEYERRSTDIDPWKPDECQHCEEPLGYHWQTADGKVWCVRNIEGKRCPHGYRLDDLKNLGFVCTACRAEGNA